MGGLQGGLARVSTAIDAVATPGAQASGTHFTRVAHDIGRYGIGLTLSKLLTLLTLPIATRLFAPAEFGIVELLTTLTASTTTVCLFGMDSAVEAL